MSRHAKLTFLTTGHLTYVRIRVHRRSPCLSWPRRRERVAPSAGGEAPRSRVSPHWTAPTYTPEEDTMHIFGNFLSAAQRKNYPAAGMHPTTLPRTRGSQNSTRSTMHSTVNTAQQSCTHSTAKVVNRHHTQRPNYLTITTRNSQHNLTDSRNNLRTRKRTRESVSRDA